MPKRNNIVARGPGRPSREEVYERLDTAIAEVRDRLGGLPTPTEARAIWDELWVYEAHSSPTRVARARLADREDSPLEASRTTCGWQWDSLGVVDQKYLPPASRGTRPSWRSHAGGEFQ